MFGLRAILCEILTGKAPYFGRSYEEARRKAANGDLADALARLDACGADQELISQTKKCLSPEASDRPKDAHAAADALGTYLDGYLDAYADPGNNQVVLSANVSSDGAVGWDDEAQIFAGLSDSDWAPLMHWGFTTGNNDADTLFDTSRNDLYNAWVTNFWRTNFFIGMGRWRRR